jgi:hypothetical protein
MGRHDEAPLVRSASHMAEKKAVCSALRMYLAGKVCGSGSENDRAAWCAGQAEGWSEFKQAIF